MSLLGEAFDGGRRFGAGLPASEDEQLPRGAGPACVVAAALCVVAVIWWGEHIGPAVRLWTLLAVFAVFCAGVILSADEFLVRDWSEGNARILAYSFRSRDRRGRRLPGRRLRRILQYWASGTAAGAAAITRARPRRAPFDEQPVETLLALAASGHSEGIERAVLNSLGVADLLGMMERYAACPVLTKIDLVHNDDVSVRERASTLIPETLWRRAWRKLWRSKYAEARVAAVRCNLPTRAALLKASAADRAALVRDEAWERVEASLTPPEALRLSRSAYADARLRAVLSGRLLRPRLLLMSGRDEAESVRAVAWEALSHELSAEEAAALVRSPHAEIRFRAVNSGRVARTLLLGVGGKDSNRPVRMAALRQLTGSLDRREAITLSGFPDVESRAEAVESGVLPRGLLLKLCCSDEEEAVRQLAWGHVRDDLSRKEANKLARSKHRRVLVWALKSGKLSAWRERRLLRRAM